MLKEREFYSVALRKVVLVPKKNISVEVDRNRRPRLVGDYRGFPVFKYIKLSDAQRLANKYN